MALFSPDVCKQPPLFFFLSSFFFSVQGFSLAHYQIISKKLKYEPEHIFYVMRRKGVTPVIAVILLLLIVVVMIGGVFTWMNLVQEDIEEATREQIVRFIDDIQREVSVVTYSCGNSVHVHNAWDRPINATIYLDGENKERTTLNNGQDINLVDDDNLNLEGDDIAEGNHLEVSSEGYVVASEVFRC